MIDLGPTRKIEGMVPSTGPKFDLTGFDKPRKPGFGDMMRNPQVLGALAKMLSPNEGADEERNPYAGPSAGMYGRGGQFDYFGG